MHDILIQGGTVVDGSGAPARQADVAVRGGRIAAVGSGLGAAQRVVAARGLLVTPGFVDIHTHYDGQATWDPYMSPSSWHGVTTVVMGNCGVGFAPVRVHDRERLIELMEGVEDIPGIALHEGQLGWWNVALNALFCLMVIFACVSGVVMWWMRRPAGRIGRPRTGDRCPQGAAGEFQDSQALFRGVGVAAQHDGEGAEEFAAGSVQGVVCLMQGRHPGPPWRAPISANIGMHPSAKF